MRKRRNQLWRLRLLVVVGLRLILQQMPNLPIQGVGIFRLITLRFRLILLQGLGFPIRQLIMHIRQLAVRVLLGVLGLPLTLLVQGFPILVLMPV